MNYKSLKFFILFLLIFLSSQAYGEIVAKPGTFDHFQIETPDKLIAGEESIIILYAVDIFGNPLNMPADSSKNYKIIASGSAKILPEQFKSNEITQSGLKIKILAEKAEDIILHLYEEGKAFPVLEKKIKIIPNVISALDIKAPETVSVGNEIVIKIFGKDKFGNNVCKDFDANLLNLFFKGEVTPQIKEIQFIPESCGVNVKIYSEKIGKFYIEANLLNKNIYGKGNLVEIVNGEVSGFIVESPSEAVVDEPFDITITAIDKFKNIVKDLSSQKEKVIIEAKGKGYIFPSELSTHAFSDGIAKLNLRYNRPEEIKIYVKVFKEDNIKGESDTIKVVPPEIKKFQVVTPETIITGQKFKAKVIAYNHLDKVMVNYNQYGKNVLLMSTGSGTLTPNRIPPTAFVNGVAIVELIYDRAEKFDIIAIPEEEEMPSIESKVKEEKKEKPKEKKVSKPAKEKKSEVSKKKTKHKAQQSSHKVKKAEELSKESILELQNISFVETKSNATLTLFIPNIGKRGGYHPVTKKDGSTMSIILEVYPAQNKLEKPIQFESDFIKDITVTEDGNKVVLSIVLKKPLKYRTFKKSDELIIEFRRS